MAEENSGDRTEPASPKRRQEAREEGRVARSTDLSTALVLIGALVTLSALGQKMLSALQETIRVVLGQVDQVRLDPNRLQGLLIQVCLPALQILLYLILALLVIGVAATLLQIGWMITPKVLMPKFERFNPLSGLGRIFSLGSVATLVTGMLKLAAVGYIGYCFLERLAPRFTGLANLQVWELLPYTGNQLLAMGWQISLALLAIGVADFLFQWWRLEQSLKMSKQEIKEEHKRDEGDPQIKQRIRQVQRQRAMQRMMESVPKATVVVTNPTHVAVALRYDPATMAAPLVVAKGREKIAEKIKALANRHDIPIVEEPPLARALLKSAEVGREIPSVFYQAIAQVLAIVFRRRNPPRAALGAAGIGGTNLAAAAGRPWLEPSSPGTAGGG